MLPWRRKLSRCLDVMTSNLRCDLRKMIAGSAGSNKANRRGRCPLRVARGRAKPRLIRVEILSASERTSPPLPYRVPRRRPQAHCGVGGSGGSPASSRKRFPRRDNVRPAIKVAVVFWWIVDQRRGVYAVGVKPKFTLEAKSPRQVVFSPLCRSPPGISDRSRSPPAASQRPQMPRRANPNRGRIGVFPVRLCV